jgi:hypothetical protein
MTTANAILQDALNYVLARASETTTWIGIATAIPALALHANLIAMIGALIASVALVVVKERRPLTAAVVIGDATPLVVQAVDTAMTANATVA